MPVVFFIDAFVALWLIYIVTILLHLMGIPIFKMKELNLGLAIIPFYYWLHNEKKKVVKKEQNTKQTKTENEQI